VIATGRSLMPGVLDINEFLEAFRNVTNESSLLEALDRVTWSLGFTGFALGHHVDLSRGAADAIRLTNYADDWVAHVIDRGYFADDPIHLASTRTANGFAWHEVDRFISLSPRHKQILAEAAGFGLTTGFTIPVHVPGEYNGTCSFAASSSDRLHKNAFAFAQLCGSFAFEAARRIMQRHRHQPTRIPDLTPRQLEALVLVGRGKTDHEIGDILGVSHSTAHEHVEGARRAYGNAQRAYMIVRALFDGQVAFADLLRR
jgi:LuxR family quorum-sensing system transcriptional regulator CciR